MRPSVQAHGDIAPGVQSGAVAAGVGGALEPPHAERTKGITNEGNFEKRTRELWRGRVPGAR